MQQVLQEHQAPLAQRVQQVLQEHQEPLVQRVQQVLQEHAVIVDLQALGAIQVLQVQLERLVRLVQ